MICKSRAPQASSRNPRAPQARVLSLALRLAACAALTLPPAGLAEAQHVRLVGDGEEWTFFRGVTEPAGAAGEWQGLHYDDSAWETGVPAFGFSDRDDVTALADMNGRYVSLYARRRFALGVAPLPDGIVAVPGMAFCPGGGGPLPALDHLWLAVDYDDGFVAYLNGVEIARRGLGQPGSFVPHDALAGNHEAGTMEIVDVSHALGLIEPGENVLALQGHNSSLSSSDFTLAATLYATGPVVVTRYPYLQRPGPDLVTVAWKTEQPSLGAVVLVPASRQRLQTPRVVWEKVPATFHAVEVAGLPPGTAWAYVVMAGNRPLTGGDLFRTLPAPGTSTIEFNALGDSGEDTGRSRAVRSRWIATGVTLGLRLGDLAYHSGSEQDFEDRYFHVYRDFLSRGFDMTAIGNHESYTNNAQPYLDNLFLPTDVPGGTERYYSFETGPALFVSVDADTSDYSPGSPQGTWLESTLASSTRPWKFVFLHQPPYSCSYTHGSNMGARQALSPLFERYGVDIVFTGHDHGYERSRPVLDYVPDGNPVRYIISGGGGWTVYPWSTACTWTQAAASEEELVKVSVDGPCLSLQAVRPDGSILDAEAYCKSLQPPAAASGQEPPPGGGAWGPNPPAKVRPSDPPAAGGAGSRLGGMRPSP